MQKYYEKRLAQAYDSYNRYVDELHNHYIDTIREHSNRINELSARNEAILSSTSWKITKPLRVLMRLFKNDAHTKAAIKQLFRRKKHGGADNRAELPQRLSSDMPVKYNMDAMSSVFNVVYISEGPETNVGYDYRCKYYAQAAQAMGADVSIIAIGDVTTHLPRIRQADILIVWRSAFYGEIALAVDEARKNGAIIVFDVDDLIFEPGMARVSIIDGMRFHALDANYFQSVRDTAHAADRYIAPTSTLSMYLRNMGKPTYKLVNGFDDAYLIASRVAVRKRQTRQPDGLIRIGYAGGTKTHQKDFAVAADAIARILEEHPQVRLVLFRRGNDHLLDTSEYPRFKTLESQVEWRNFVPHNQLPGEMARFDISLAPLEVGNPFCEAKSELKFFESALCNACVIASPTEPYQNAIRQGVTGFLAENEDDWYRYIKLLVTDAKLRTTMSAAALRSVLWPFGYQRRVIAVSNTLNQMFDDQSNRAVLFSYEQSRQKEIPVSQPALADYDIAFFMDTLKGSYVTVVIPLYNYENYLVEALASVKDQTLRDIDLVVVDDQSSDQSLDVAVQWAKVNADRFNRIVIAANRENRKLDVTRNTAIELAETPYVFPLDPDNRLLPECLERCLDTIMKKGVSFAYPAIRQFGDGDGIMGTLPYNPSLMAGGNYVDAMALIAKGAWAEANGYRNFSESGWEDFSLWCTFIEKGMSGASVGGEPLAEYRVHGQSMLRTTTDMANKKKTIVHEMEARHPWLTLTEKISTES